MMVGNLKDHLRYVPARLCYYDMHDVNKADCFVPPTEEPRYERDRSASPRPMKRDDGYRGGRDRSASPNNRMNSR